MADPDAVTHTIRLKSGANGFSELLDGTETGLVTYLGLNIYGFIMPEEDVAEGSFYEQAALWAYEMGITTGTTKTTFSPNKTCTRAEMVTFLWRFAGCMKADSENPFVDVEESAFYYEAVLWALENGITTGVTETTFAPISECNRAEAAVFLFRLING